MQNVMIDLETLGTGADCAILSIGAIEFQNGIGNFYYTVINTQSCLDNERTVDQSTIDWWSKQSDESRTVFEEAKVSTITLESALLELNKFIDGRKVWGNGADFDNTIIASSMRWFSINPSWKFYNNRCFRTLKSLVNLPLITLGLKHSALFDAMSQAYNACRMLRYLDWVKETPKLSWGYEEYVLAKIAYEKSRNSRWSNEMQLMFADNMRTIYDKLLKEIINKEI